MKTSLHVCECFPEKMWRMMPDWLLALLGAAVLAAIAVCFATGVCEFAAVVAGLGALTAAAVIAILKQPGSRTLEPSAAAAGSGFHAQEKGQSRSSVHAFPERGICREKQPKR